MCRIVIAGILGLVCLTALTVHLARGAECKTPRAAGAERRASKEAPAEGGEVQLTESDRGQTAVVPLGKSIVLRLPGDRAAGYNWEIGSVSGDAVKLLGKPEYVPAREPPRKSSLAGAFIFRFSAVKVGRSTIRLQYVRPGQKKSALGQVYRVDIVVKQQ